MNIIELLDADTCLRVVQMLLHFLWQGLLIVVVVAGLNAVARRKSAAFRYRVAAAAMLLMAACLPATFFALAPETLPVAEQPRPSRSHSEANGSRNEPEFAGPVSLEAFPPTVAPEVAEPSLQADTVEPPPQTPTNLWVSASPYIVAAYLAGVLLMMTRLVFAFAGGERLRRTATPIEDASMLEMFAEKAKGFGMRIMPAILCCERVATPIIVGVFKPTILLPVCILTELSPLQIEAVLAHELAHIRRLDHVANMIQRIIESLLFFHPAVWYVSRCVSQERENCCDDMVVAHGTKATSYAELLVRISELSQSWPAPSAATLAATGGKPTRLRERVLRLLGQAKDTPIRLSRVAIVVVSAVVLMAFAGSLYIHAQAANSSADSDDFIRAHIFYRPDGTDHYRKIRVGSTGTTYKTLLSFFPNASTDESGMGAAGRSAPLIVELERRDKTRHRISCDLTQFWNEGNGDRQLHDATGLKQFLDETYFEGRYVTWAEFVGDDPVEVEAVCRAPFGRSRWWGPEGVGCGFELDDKERNPAAGNYLIAIRHETDASARKFEVPGALVVNIDDRPGGLKMIQFKLADAAATTATLRVGVATDPWTTVLRTTEPTTIEHKLGSIEITAVKMRGSRGSIAALIPRAFSELHWDLVAVDRNGNPHHNDGEDATDVDQPGVVLEEFEYDLGSEEIHSFELRTRPFRFVEFPNIRLRPAEEYRAGQSLLDVGVTAERWIGDQADRGAKSYLDLETGRVASLPAAIYDSTPPGEDAWRWLDAEGMDVIGDIRDGLLGLKTRFAKVSGEWDAITASQVADALEGLRGDSEGLFLLSRITNATTGLRRDESEIHAFRTSAGAIGTIQIVAVDQKTKRQQVRYKLLANAVDLPDKDTSAADTKASREKDFALAAERLDPLNVISIPRKYTDPDLQLAVMYDSELNGGVPLDQGQAKAEHYYLAYLPRAKDSAERCYIYSHLSALFSTNWHREQGESPDYPKSRRYAALAIEAEPNRVGKATIRARARVQNGPDLSAEENFAGRLKFYQWLTSWDETTARKNWLPLDYQIGREDRYFPSFMRLLENVIRAETNNLTAVNSSDKQPQARLLRVVREVPGTYAAKIAQQELEALWGEAVDGVQAMLAVEQRDWTVGETPALKAMIRNGGQSDYEVARAQQLCELEVNGRRYRWGGRIRVRSSNFPPSEQFENIPVTLNESWHDKKTDDPLKLDVGRHTIRLAFSPTRPETGRTVSAPFLVFSNPVEVRVVTKQTHVAWGPVIERELTHNTDDASAYLNLKTGKHVKPASWNLQAIKDEFQKAGVDLFHSPFQNNGDQCVCRDMDVVEVKDGWKLAADQIAKTLEDARQQGKSNRNAAPIGTFLNLNVTYVFEARDGSRGVLELIPDEKIASGKRVRYKFVRAPKRDNPDEEPVGIGPVIERELTIDTDQATAYLNLKTGKHVAPMWDAFPDAKTLRAAGVDVYHASILSNHTQKMCLDVEHLTVEDGWKLTALELNEVLDRAKIARKTKQGILNPNVNYLFETRDGSRGILELVLDQVKPTVLTVRYKLVAMGGENKTDAANDEQRNDDGTRKLIGAWTGGQKVMQRLVLRADGTFDLSYPKTPRIADVIPESGVWSQNGKTLTLEITKSADKDRMGKKVAREVVYLTAKGLFLRAEDGVCTHFTQARVFHGWTLLPWFASISTEDLPDFWEERPPGSKSYNIRPNVEVIYSGIDGTVYYRADKKLFLIQSDPIGSSTHTFYGPHEGNPRKLLNLPEKKEADDKEPKTPRTGEAEGESSKGASTTTRHVVTSSSKDEVAFLDMDMGRLVAAAQHPDLDDKDKLNDWMGGKGFDAIVRVPQLIPHGLKVVQIDRRQWNHADRNKAFNSLATQVTSPQRLFSGSPDGMTYLAKTSDGNHFILTLQHITDQPKRQIIISYERVASESAKSPQANTGDSPSRSVSVQEAPSNTAVWTCLVHQQVQLSQHGECPHCGKALVLRKAPQASDADKSAAWGEAVEGVLAGLLVRGGSHVVPRGATTWLIARTRQIGTVDLIVAAHPRMGCRLEVDGKWYRWSGANRKLAVAYLRTSDYEQRDLEVPLDLPRDVSWRDDNDGVLTLSPGKHAVRLSWPAFHPQKDDPLSPDQNRPVELITNQLVLEVGDTKSDAAGSDNTGETGRVINSADDGVSGAKIRKD